MCMYPGCTITKDSCRIITPSKETWPIFGVYREMFHFVKLITKLFIGSRISHILVLDVVQDLNLERVTTLDIAQYLLNETGTDLCLKETDTLCKSCYDMYRISLISPRAD